MYSQICYYTFAHSHGGMKNSVVCEFKETIKGTFRMKLRKLSSQMGVEGSIFSVG